MTQADTGKWYAYVASDIWILLLLEPLLLLLTSDHCLAADSWTPTATRSATIQRVSFDDDSDIDVVLGDETITLHYEQDLDDLATVSTDRAGVPIGGQVHVTVSDFRLNLDPTGEDRWIMYANGTAAAYANAAVDTPSQSQSKTQITGLEPLAAWAESSQLPQMKT